jgi:hypothetical protein
VHCGVGVPHRAPLVRKHLRRRRLSHADGAGEAKSEHYLIAAARAALSGGEWDTARDGFTRAIEQRETPEALEGLGWALWWLEKTEPSFAAREKAYRAYLAQSDPLAAARVATFLALDIYDFHGEAVSNGWLQRAKRHLEGIETAAEHGWIALWEGHFVRLLHGDVATARRLATEAITIARRIGVPDLELLGIALEGHALVAEGRVEEGMRQLDEATAAALAGDISDLDAAGAACCFLMHACEQVRDYDRAAQWADRVAEFSRRWRIRPLYAICRVHYAVVLHISALTGERTSKLLEAIDRVAATRRQRVKTPELNRFIERVAAEHPPASPGRRHVRILYAAQTAVAPPTFVLFTNVATQFHFSYQRYLENRLREEFGFQGTPLRLHVRARRSRSAAGRPARHPAPRGRRPRGS